VSRLSDQVEVKIARANRAFRVSSRIIAAARDELERHGAWLDRHRATWAEEVKRHRRLLNRKLALRALMRFTVGLVFAAPFALARAIEARLKGSPAQASPQLRPAEREPQFTRAAALQLRIGRLDERLATKGYASGRTPQQCKMPRECPPPPEGAVSRARAAPARFPAGKLPVSPVGIVLLVLIAVGAVRAMLSGAPDEVPALAAAKASAQKPHSAAASLTVAKAPKKVEAPAPLSGFATHAAAPSSEAVRLPPQTVADMMSITHPLALDPTSTETAATPVAEQPPAPKPAAKAKRKRTVAAREPQPLPWWQEWSWIRLR